MNIYRCVSEGMTGYHYSWYYPEGFGMPEPYCIAELVAAETPGKAKYAAWKTDRDSFSFGMADMPKFSVVRTRQNVNLPAGVITNPRPAWWETPKEISAKWRTRHGEEMVPSWI